MIDLHCHVLPGIDDGPATTEQAVELARAAAAAGTTMMVATPHVSSRYPNRPGPIRDAVNRLNADLRAASLAFAVAPGAEISITQLDELSGEQLTGLRLGDGPYVLIECSFDLMVDVYPNLLAALRAAGHSVVLAHPERCPGFHRRPELLGELAKTGAVTSVTAGSFTGQFGREVQRFTLAMAADGLVHNVASDAHDLLRRPPDIAGHLDKAGFGHYIDLLTDEVPRAILAGSPLPARPEALFGEPTRRRGLWHRRAAQ